MKLRMVLVLSTAIIFLSVMALADGKDNCSSKNSSVKKASCCMHGTKASMSCDAKSAQKAKAECKADSKECNVKEARMSSDCPMQGKSECDMSKSSMKKTSGASDCCKAKDAETKDTGGKSNQGKSAPESGERN